MNNKYALRCRYYNDLEGDYVEIGKINLPEKPRAGELIWMENKQGKRLFVVLETIRQYYSADGFETELLSNDVFVCEIKLNADEHSTEGETND